MDDGDYHVSISNYLEFRRIRFLSAVRAVNTTTIKSSQHNAGNTTTQS